MIKCQNCGRENDDSFSFCLDCGADLKPGPKAQTGTGAAAAPAAPSTGTAPAAPPTAAAPATAPTDTAQARASQTPAPPQEDRLPCPNCGVPIGVSDVFCSSCGHRMDEQPGQGSTMFMHRASPDTAAKPRARMILIKPDGSEGTVFTVAAAKTVMGRSQGIIMFPKDQYISPSHAQVGFKDGKLTITDLDSLNGIFFKITQEARITPGTYFRIGRQLLRLEVQGDFQSMDIKPPEGDDSALWGSPPPQVWARLVQVLEGGKIGEIHLLTQPEVIIGREDSEIRFPEDGFISSRHCLLINRDGDCFLRDLGSSNGTYLRIHEPQELKNEDRIQIGNQVLKVDLS